jgi:hypothetical protein
MVKIAELERNEIGKIGVYRFSHNKADFTKKLPIKFYDYEVLYGKDKWSSYVITVWDGDIEVISLALEQLSFYSIRGFDIESITVAPAYQGKALGYQLYKKLVTDMDLALFSYGSHSVGARKLWVKLSKDPEVSVFGFDIVDKKVFKVSSNRENTELTSKFVNLYGKSGAGVILVRKSSMNDKRLTNMSKAEQFK